MKIHDFSSDLKEVFEIPECLRTGADIFLSDLKILSEWDNFWKLHVFQVESASHPHAMHELLQVFSLFEHRIKLISRYITYIFESSLNLERIGSGASFGISLVKYT